MKSSSRTSKDVRLPKNVVPIHYALSITPDLKKFTFAGTVTVTLKVVQPTNAITLHAKDLKIVRVEMAQGTPNARRSKAKKIAFDEKRETVTVTFPEKLHKGTARLELSFSGILTDRMRGFYRSRYTVKSKEEYLATTQFEPTDARRAFPCFDEPDLKAVFNVSVFAPKGMTAISNTPTISREKKASGAVHHFASTPKMSTYLLAFIIGKFEYVSQKTKEGIEVRVYTTPDKKEQGTFACETAARALSFYNDYFGIPYPLPMLQLIAIPDFEAAAMENWGAITYREGALLIDATHSSTTDKEWVAAVVAHELAHQWFGNLVTMEWWTHLWLNEGFAKYMETVTVDALFPEWDMWTQFTARSLGLALRLDGLKNTHPIEAPVHDPSEINEIFDGVSYEKGATVIRMLAHYLGEATFKKGLKIYLTRHQFGNAGTEDLWRAFESASGKPVRAMMKNWTAKPGYPYLAIEEKKGGALAIRQQRFLGSAKELAASQDTTLWSVPLGIMHDQGARMMKKKNELLKSGTFERGVKFNEGETGLFRVRYPDTWYPLLGRRLGGDGTLKAPDRLGLLRDMFAFAESGTLSVSHALQALPAYKQENDYHVWSIVSAGIGQIGNLLFHTPHYETYRMFARGMFSDIAHKMGWEKRMSENHADTMLRALTLLSFGAYGDKDTLRIARERFVSTKAISPDLRDVVYELVAKHGDEKDHATFISMYKKASGQQQEEHRVGSALSSFRNEKLLAKTLDFAFSKAVRSQDAPFLFIGVGVNPYGRELAWKFLQKNWKMIFKRYGTGGHMLSRFMHPLGGFTDLARAREVRAFFKTHEAPGAERAVLQALERIESNANWLARDEKNIAKFLSNSSFLLD